MTRRVVHVVDLGGRAREGARGVGAIGAMACAEACAATPELGHVVVMLGAEGDVRAAEELGLRAEALASAPLGAPALAWRSLRWALRRLGGHDVVQPWSERSARACRAAGAVPAAIPTGLVPSFASRGQGDRARIRSGLGVATGTPMIALLADPVWHADARRFVYMIGLLDVAGQQVAGLVGRGTAHTARAERFHTEAAVGWRLLLTDAPVISVVQGCDLAVIVPPAPHRRLSRCDRAWARWSVVRSHLLGVPVVAGSEWLDEELCPASVRGALGAESASITDLGRRLARLVADAEERARVARAVRARALSISSREHFGEALRAHWGVPRKRGGADALGGAA